MSTVWLAVIQGRVAVIQGQIEGQAQATQSRRPGAGTAWQIQSGENQVKSNENWEKLGILKKLTCHHLWLSHLTPTMVGGALSQSILHWTSQEAP
jgi:hypothetical protein